MNALKCRTLGVDIHDDTFFCFLSVMKYDSSTGVIDPRHTTSTYIIMYIKYMNTEHFG